MTEPQAAVAIVHAREPREAVLVIRRSERKDDPWSGHWSFPGGRRDAEDPDLLHTALRELEEECGIRLQREHASNELTPVLARRRTGPFVLVAPFVFTTNQMLPARVDHEEAVEARWVPLSVWHDPGQHVLSAVQGLPRDTLFPAINLNGVPLWGFTYRLTTSWLGLIPTHEPIERAGFQMARRVLDFLLLHGMKLRSEWEERPVTSGAEQQAMVAVVEGEMPVERVLAHFSLPADVVPKINLLEVKPSHVRIMGLAFEEYFIVAQGQ